MGELTSMRNIGREMARKLAAVGIDSPEKLTETGAKEAFFRLKGTFPEVCLVHLYALEGAVTGQEYNQAPGGDKAGPEGLQRFFKEGEGLKSLLHILGNGGIITIAKNQSEPW